MLIDFKKMEDLGFHVDADKDRVLIYPRNGRPIVEELQKLTELSMRDCEQLQMDIQEMQIMRAIKHISE